MHHRRGGGASSSSSPARAKASWIRASAAAPGGTARVELKRRLFELSHSVLMEIMAQTRNTYSDDDDEDMSKEAREMKDIFDVIVPLVGVANLWDYMPLLRWFDVYGVKKKLRDAVNRRNTFIYKMIDAEREKLEQLERKNGEGDANNSDEKKSMIGVMLSLQKTEPDVYTDTFISALVAVSGTIHVFFKGHYPCFHVLSSASTYLIISCSLSISL